MLKLIYCFNKQLNFIVNSILIMSVFIIPKTNFFADETALTENQLACEQEAGSTFQTDILGKGIPADKINSDQAIKVCTQAIKEQPNSAKYQFLLARALSVGKQNKKAVAY